MLEVKGNGIGCGIARPHSIHTVSFFKLLEIALVFRDLEILEKKIHIRTACNKRMLICTIPTESLIGRPCNRTVFGNLCGEVIVVKKVTSPSV